MPNNPTRHPALLLGLAALLATATGCAGPTLIERITSNIEPLDITPDDLADRLAPFDRLGVVVQNHKGAVRVRAAGPDAKPEVDVTWVWGSDIDGTDRPGPSIRYFFNVSPGPDGRGVLRIVGRDRSLGRNEGRGDLTIVLPRVDGIEVRTASGPVVLEGVTGAVTVVNTAPDGQPARIEWRTDRPVRDPVALSTERGRIAVAMPDDGSLDLELRTSSGKASFASGSGRFGTINAGGGLWRGVWNGGEAPFVASTGGGDIRVEVLDDPLRFGFIDRFNPAGGERRD